MRPCSCFSRLFESTCELKRSSRKPLHTSHVGDVSFIVRRSDVTVPLASTEQPVRLTAGVSYDCYLATARPTVTSCSVPALIAGHRSPLLNKHSSPPTHVVVSVVGNASITLTTEWLIATTFYSPLQAQRIFMDNMDRAHALSSGTPGHRVPEGTSSLEASASLFGTQRPTPSPALSLVSVFVFAFVPLLKFLYKWQRFEPSVQLKRRCPFGSTILHDTLFVNLPSVVQGVLSAAEGHAQHPAHVACRSYFVHLRQMQLFLRGINASAADDRRTGALSCSIHSSLTSYAVSVSSLLATGARY
ncbi:hypothetical protein MTO96_038913 [Rhipicephalus appendiculatus]